MHFVIFGGTGDLSQRKLIPSLYHMHCDLFLQENARIHIAARGDLSQADCQNMMQQAITEYVEPEAQDAAEVAAFLERLHYQKLDVYDDQAWQKFTSELVKDDQYAFYMAVPPSAFAPISQALHQYGFAEDEHLLVVEKPLGEDAKSADEINDILTQSFDEAYIYRIDHYLGKETVKTWTDLRLQQSELSACWSDRYIDRIEISVMETVGVEGRFEYLDRIGVLRDMVQNHMLQLLTLTMMDVGDQGSETLLQAKSDILKNLKLCDAAHMMRGQYAAGQINGENVPAYLDEIAGHAKGEGDTYVALRSFADTDQWRHTDIYLRMGKRMAKRQADIVIYFTDEMVKKYALELPYLQVNIQPDMVVSPKSNAMKLLGQENLTTQKERHMSAYEALLRDLHQGNKTFFVQGDENHIAWEWVDHIRATWCENKTAFYQYAAGSYGPEEAQQILKAGHKWYEDM